MFNNGRCINGPATGGRVSNCATQPGWYGVEIYELIALLENYTLYDPVSCGACFCGL